MKELTLAAEIESISSVTDFVNEELEAIGCPMKTQIQIDIAIDELFSNIVFYAYEPHSGSVTVQFEVESDPPAVRLTFIDSGKPYNPLEAEEPDITSSAEDRKIGGLGIFMVRKSMDDMQYAFRDGQNILTIRKKL